ncbi:twinfilin-1-like [Lineus longissimus]|uniref:twinfilin-1-like n=1 Tax=Lineus longissimus TaxID=88925 RepID=UPI002B4E21B1
MSHQTGIKASDDLKGFLGTAKNDGHVRVIKIGISNEQLVLCSSADAVGSWEEDYDSVVKPLVDENPCYMFYRLDSKEGGHAYDWVLLHYAPDDCKVRDKMLYASTKATMKQEFGGGLIKAEVFGTEPKDILLEGYKRHKLAESAPPPMSMAELELEEIKKNEDRSEIHTNTRQQTLTGLMFPMDDQALDKIDEFAAKTITYVQFSIDIPGEMIRLTDADDIDAKSLLSKVPEDCGSYHLFRYKHTHEGDYTESPVFIYIVPGYSTSIKERMLYSSIKGPLTQSIQGLIQEDIAKIIEVDTPSSELTEECLYDQVHPKKTIVRPKFAKPKGPAGRAPRSRRPAPEEES